MYSMRGQMKLNRDICIIAYPGACTLFSHLVANSLRGLVAELQSSLENREVRSCVRLDIHSAARLTRIRSLQTQLKRAHCFELRCCRHTLAAPVDLRHILRIDSLCLRDEILQNGSIRVFEYPSLTCLGRGCTPNRAFDRPVPPP